jgi:hypothetical protein
MAEISSKEHAALSGEARARPSRGSRLPPRTEPQLEFPHTLFAELAAHEDAERMSSGVGVHAQRLLRIVEAVQEELSPERQRSLVLSFQILCRRDHEIQVQLLRDRPLWPCRPRELGHLLERHPGGARWGAAAPASPLPPDPVCTGLQSRRVSSLAPLDRDGDHTYRPARRGIARWQQPTPCSNSRSRRARLISRPGVFAR